MVRATRSTAALQNQQSTEQPLSATAKRSTRKRTRSSVAPVDDEEQRATKQRRGEVKEEEEEEPGVGGLPLNSEDAATILDILETIDTQGLLDRVFPLPETEEGSDSQPGSSKDADKMYSLRALLKDSTSHPLRVIRSAIRPLFPITSHPRTKPSIPVAQQLHFCNLALSLLDQSSQNHPAIALSESTLFPESRDIEQSSVSSSGKKRKYALVQRLPGGNWWTSFNSAREGETGLTPQEVKTLRNGQAELVSIIPSLPLPPANQPTLGELQLDTKRESRLRFKPLHMHPRPLSSGTFLDYGAFTSFAPSFDSEGAEVGRNSLGEIMMGRINKKKIKGVRRKLLARLQAEQDSEESGETMDVEWQDRPALCEILSSLFPDKKLDGLEEALQLLQVEEDVAALLEKNAKALEKLNLLQIHRLKNGNLPVKENSEEWTLAQEIFNSLTLLAALRPRVDSSATGEDHAPLIPPVSVLRALHSTLPSAPAFGWQGTLDESRKTALRDDTTAHVKVGATVTPPQPAAQTYGTSTPYATNGPYRPAAPYAYHAPVIPRPGAQTAAPNQSTYYPNVYLQSQSGQVAAQYQYPYAQWYNYPAPGQKIVAPPYHSTYMAQGTTPRAVGNTAKPQQAQQNGWTQSYGQQAATLPPHLRRAGTSTPGSPNTVFSTPYHAYVPTPQPGR